MKNLASIAAGAVHASQAHATGEDAAEASLLNVSPVIRKLFLLLHGSYGTLFTSKFSTGQMAGKHDKGSISAMRVWDAKLSRFPADVVESAANRLSSSHPKHPPNLPEFEALCDAAMPRQTYPEQQAWPRLAAPVIEPIKVDLQSKNDGKDWARRSLYRVDRGDKSVGKYAAREARIALGMEGKQKWQ